MWLGQYGKPNLKSFSVDWYNLFWWTFVSSSRFRDFLTLWNSLQKYIIIFVWLGDGVWSGSREFTSLREYWSRQYFLQDRSLFQVNLTSAAYISNHEQIARLGSSSSTDLKWWSGWLGGLRTRLRQAKLGLDCRLSNTPVSGLTPLISLAVQFLKANELIRFYIPDYLLLILEIIWSQTPCTVALHSFSC